MIQTWLYTIFSVFAVSLIAFVGLFTISIQLDRLKKILLFLVSFAAGALLGDAFLHLLPEAIDKNYPSLNLALFILLGMVIFFILEKIIHWYHCHIPTSEEHPHPVGLMNLVGDGLHNFIDGAIIAGSYLISPALGLATTLAVILHEIPQEMGDFGILIHAGYSRGRALFYNFLSALTAVLGAALTIMIGLRISNITELLIPITIGSFIYIATADLIPELKKETALGKSFLQLISLLLGIGLMWVFVLME
jgi:zinc and cadmium transporter